MVERVFFAGGINSEAGVLDAVDDCGAFASGSNVVLFTKDGSGALTADPDTFSHDGHVHSVSIVQEDGKTYVLTSSSDKTIRIWAGRLLVATTEHDHELLHVKAHTGLSRLVAYDDQGSVLVYERTPHAQYLLKQTITYSPKRVHSVAWSCEGVLAIGTSDKLIRLLVERDGQMTEVLSLSGHTNWVTCMEWSPLTEEGSRFLASCGPDKTVRLWKLSRKRRSAAAPKLVELIPAKNSFSLDSGEDFVLENEAILYGHEGMVNSCQWAKSNRDGAAVRDLRLISSSADHTLIVWALGASTWSSVTHIGDISGSGSVGGDRSFGFFSGILFNDTILCHGSSGNVQCWKRSSTGGTWEPGLPLTGHFRSVSECSWDRGGRFLLTASLDQTTRAFAPAGTTGKWHEIGRPQIHGYDLQCIATASQDTFVSGADEKVFRVFRMPDAFKVRVDALGSGDGCSEAASTRPTVLPALGLSNKLSSFGEDASPAAAEMPLGRPPTESDLCRHTLWPEIDKMYGHGYELYSLAVNATGDLIASAARANLSADAEIRFWVPSAGEASAVHWTAAPNGHISGHTLTVVSLRFSPSGRYLLATSRDRTWSIVEITRSDDGQLHFCTIQREEGHSRIVWSGAWESDNAFVTVSRDKTLKTWRREGVQFVLRSSLQFDAGVTAVDVNPEGSLLAAGEETGQVAVFGKEDGGDWSVLTKLRAASDAINDVKWHPAAPQLAVVSADRSVRIFRLA